MPEKMRHEALSDEATIEVAAKAVEAWQSRGWKLVSEIADEEALQEHDGEEIAVYDYEERELG